MTIVRTVAELRSALRELRVDGVGFVPTMGALHEGHLSLIRAARQDYACVVVSIFVNPTQFTEATDLANYPRDEAHDVALATAAGASLVFAPDVAEMYPAGFATTVSVAGTITETLEGAVRGNEHFDGVATIVAKLLIAVAPDAAYFGAKDAQQTVVVRRMVADLGIPTRVVICPTSRDANGLARSSRNARLAPEAYQRALAIPRALRGMQEAVSAGERQVSRLRILAAQILAQEGITAEYLAFVQPDTLAEVALVQRPTLCAIAARVGEVRLIDNEVLVPGLAPAR